MKKNIMMRIASILLVCVLVTTCGISGTFAKYVTSAESTDNARVAKWGVTVTGKTPEQNDLFVKEYDEMGSVTVSAAVDVVAPGTAGTLNDFDITGTPEVAVRVRYEATVTVSGWAITGDDFYCPIEVFVNGNVIDGEDYDSANEFATAIKNAIQNSTNSTSYAVREIIDSTMVVNWEWDFEVDNTHNAKDTLLGDSVENHTISIVVSCIVEQID